MQEWRNAGIAHEVLRYAYMYLYILVQPPQASTLQREDAMAMFPTSFTIHYQFIFLDASLVN